MFCKSSAWTEVYLNSNRHVLRLLKFAGIGLRCKLVALRYFSQSDGCKLSTPMAAASDNIC